MGAAYDSPGYVSRLPGLSMDAHDSAMTAAGSSPSRSSPGAVPLTGESGLQGVGTVMSLKSQADPGSDTVNQPGQTGESVISVGPEEDYAYTGAGQGEAIVDTSHRYDWQQKAQGS
jgi:hypothetical protein